MSGAKTLVLESATVRKQKASRWFLHPQIQWVSVCLRGGDTRAQASAFHFCIKPSSRLAVWWTWQWGSIVPGRHFSVHWQATHGGGLCCYQKSKERTCRRPSWHLARTTQMCYPPSSSCFTFNIPNVWRTGKVPVDWKDGIIVILYKGKEPKSECSNSTLLSVPGKVFAHVILARIQTILDMTHTPQQSGFDAILAVRLCQRFTMSWMDL